MKYKVSICASFYKMVLAYTLIFQWVKLVNPHINSANHCAWARIIMLVLKEGSLQSELIHWKRATWKRSIPVLKAAKLEEDYKYGGW